MNIDNAPFEANYESAKQSIIGFLSEVSRAYDLPAPIINILIYEIALESRNNTFSAIIGNCEVSYPEELGTEKNPVMAPKKSETQVAKTEDALKEFEKTGIEIENSSQEQSA